MEVLSPLPILVRLFSSKINIKTALKIWLRNPDPNLSSMFLEIVIVYESRNVLDRLGFWDWK